MGMRHMSLQLDPAGKLTASTWMTPDLLSLGKKCLDGHLGVLCRLPCMLGPYVLLQYKTLQVYVHSRDCSAVVLARKASLLLALQMMMAPQQPANIV